MAIGVNELRTGFTDTAIQKRVITDMIELVDWTEVPLLKYFGLDNHLRFKFVNWPHRKYEWQEDELNPELDLINGAINSSVTTIAVDNGAYFRPGHMAKIGTEHVRVTAVSGNNLTVVRGYSGTTAASHSDNDPIEILYTAMEEGADVQNEYTTKVDGYYNIRQIFSGGLKVSGSQQAFSDYGITDTKGYHLAKLIGGEKVGTKWRSGAVMKQFEKTFWNGVRFQASTNAAADTMGGYEQFVTTNVTDAGGTRLSRKIIEDLVQDCHDNNGNPNTIICGTFQKRVISQMFEGIVRTDRTETQGGQVISTLVTDFGDLDVITHRRFPANKIYVLNKEDMGWCTLRPFDTKELETQGDYTNVFYVGEYGFALCAQMHHGYIHNLATTW